MCVLVYVLRAAQAAHLPAGRARAARGAPPANALRPRSLAPPPPRPWHLPRITIESTAHRLAVWLSYGPTLFPLPHAELAPDQNACVLLAHWLQVRSAVGRGSAAQRVR